MWHARHAMSRPAETLNACRAGRSLANPAKQLIELNPAYSPFVNLTCANNGTKSVDVFDAAVGGYHVNVSTTAYGYYRLTANATVLTVQASACCRFTHVVLAGCSLRCPFYPESACG